jgi:hypothetical protein
MNPAIFARPFRLDDLARLPALEEEIEALRPIAGAAAGADAVARLYAMAPAMTGSDRILGAAGMIDAAERMYNALRPPCAAGRALTAQEGARFARAFDACRAKAAAQARIDAVALGAAAAGAGKSA